jgi:hypothetical protein
MLDYMPQFTAQCRGGPLDGEEKSSTFNTFDVSLGDPLGRDLDPDQPVVIGWYRYDGEYFQWMGERWTGERA